MEVTEGLVVKSKAGRDNGKLFIVIKTEGDFVYVANGDTRKAENPKKKKLKHIQITSYICEGVQDNLRNNGIITNSELRKALAEYLN